MKENIKAFLPPVFVNVLSSVLGRKLEYIGRYPSFSDANVFAQQLREKQGYKGFDRQRMIESMSKLREEENIASRDGNNNVIASILSAALKKQAQKVSFVDLGGGGGSFYFLNRNKFFNSFSQYSYSVFELPEIVELGREFFADDKLSFYTDIDEFPLETDKALWVLILQGVLMYLDHPFALLEKVLKRLPFDSVILDRTAFSRDETMFFKVQKIPKSLGYGANPWSVFSKQAVIDFFQKQGFQLFDDFNDPLDGDTHDFVMRGLSFVRMS